ncbi:sensor histidine kinase [Donghicola mangrovi]|uniref:histidine kinase n=1 Tax=Donghicola mangrovi TaxID=2729614 RepID=A0A850QDQ5_9RHOB|nr:ATP-binding protein [Donghicola mangrovi]NVO25030.1 sensor histidine kinase [Donghicola mangrovi]
MWAAALAVLAGTWFGSVHLALERAREEAAIDAQTRALGVSSELARQQAVGAVLSSDPQVIAAQTLPLQAANQALSQRLEALNAEIGASVLYVMDAAGKTTSASNWREPTSFVGRSYDYRAYFQQAMAGGEGREYALGSVSRLPGLYLSRRIDGVGQPLGVVVVKLDFNEFETTWRASARPSYVAATDGTVTVTSEPALRFLPEPPETRWTIRQPVPRSDWHLVMTLPTAPVYGQGVAAVVIVGLVLTGAALVLANHTRRQAEAARYRTRLEQDVATRTAALSQEIRDREVAEAQLAEMQGTLVQANKLAALGQISAGVAHEVNQPLATIRLLAEYGQEMLPKGAQSDVVKENLAQIVRMSERIQTITSDLRGFARKARGDLGPVSVAGAWRASLRLAASRGAADRIRIIADPIPEDLRVRAETVRLEQVLVNLIQNAREALTDTPDPCITLTHRIEGGRLILRLSDNGPGLPLEVANAPFTPFQTTKPQGLGLGLVICETIMRDFGGALQVEPAAVGTTFRLNLNLWSDA